MNLNQKVILFIFMSIAFTACSGGSYEPFTLPVVESKAPSSVPSQDARLKNAGSDGIGDDYFSQMGNGGYDVQNYTLELAVNLETNNIFATTTIEAIAEDDLSQFNLDFKGFEIGQVVVNGVDATYSREGTEFTVIPSELINRGDTFTTVVTYSGRPNADASGSTFSYSEGWNNYGSGIMVAGEPSGSSSFYPVNEHPKDKATYTFIVTVKKPLVVAANGILIDKKTRGEFITYTWKSNYPIASYLVTLAIGDFDRETSDGPNGIIIRNYFSTNIGKNIRSGFDRQGEMIEYFNQIFGVYPFDAYGVVVHDLPIRFALETQTLSVFGRSFTYEFVVSHELVHSWFGNSVSLTRWQEIWLNEGFATYGSVLWTEHAYGSGAANGQLAEYYETIAPSEPVQEITRTQLIHTLENKISTKEDARITQDQVRDALRSIYSDQDAIDNLVSELPQNGIMRSKFPDLLNEFGNQLVVTNGSINNLLISIGLTNNLLDINPYPSPGSPPVDALFSRSVYYRGALALHALRLRVGDQDFFQILNTFTERYKYGNATIEDFISLSEEISGMQLDELFDAWLYAPDIPDLPEMNLYRQDFDAQN